DLVSDLVFGEAGHDCQVGPGVVDDPALRAGLEQFAAAVAGGDSRLAREGILTVAARLLVGRYGVSMLRPSRPAGAEPRGVRRARELIAARFAEDLSIAEIARAAELSPFHLMRTFRRHVGLPLHACQLQVRIEHAKRLLARGRPIAEVAL